MSVNVGDAGKVRAERYDRREADMRLIAMAPTMRNLMIRVVMGGVDDDFARDAWDILAYCEGVWTKDWKLTESFEKAIREEFESWT